MEKPSSTWFARAEFLRNLEKAYRDERDFCITLPTPIPTTAEDAPMIGIPVRCSRKEDVDL